MTTAGGSPEATPREVLVVTGAGGMGRAVARRLGSGRQLLLADVDPDALDRAAGSMRGEGHEVATQAADMSDAAQVRRLAERAHELGPVRHLVHTAGLSPVQASADAIVRVDLVGVALFLEEFLRVVEPGGAAVVVASMAWHLGPPIGPEDEQQLATVPAGTLAALGCVRELASGDSGSAYAFAKRANRLRVQASSVAWGRRGARVNSISPGVISTPMGEAELGGPVGPMMRSMVETSGTGRIGTPDDVAAAAEFLLGPQASFVTGTDLLVDGGVVGALRATPHPTG